MVPKHVAIIPDGNRRWAKKRGLAASTGHEHSACFENLRTMMQKARELGVEYVSLWVFSTENWKRPENEKKILFKLLSERLEDIKRTAHEDGLRVRWLGRRDRAPKELANALEEIEKETQDERKINLQICFDYGGRDEILRAANKAIAAGREINEEEFSSLLDTKEIPDPDLIIRTSGEMRLSGYLPWQGAYAELYFIDKHFPDFGPEDIEEAVQAFKDRERRFGGN